MDGVRAILGFDFVSFSLLPDDEQVKAITRLFRWVSESLAGNGLSEDDYRWSPAGDGGYLTFATQAAGRKAIDVAVQIARKANDSEWAPSGHGRLQLTTAIHAGAVQEERELGRDTNIWGIGINMTSRLLTICMPSQILVSRQYLDAFFDGRSGFRIGDAHWRTVKHGIKVSVCNARFYDVGIEDSLAHSMRWRAIGSLWRDTSREYEYLIHDAMNSGDPVAALAAAAFLVRLDEVEPVAALCNMISNFGDHSAADYRRQSHLIFSLMPPEMLLALVKELAPRTYDAGQTIFRRGDPARSSLLPISGRIRVEVAGVDEPVYVESGQIVGEFSLWIPQLERTATLEAADDVLALEIPNETLSAVIRPSSDVEEAIYGIVRRRIIDNALHSSLFPKATENDDGRLDGLVLGCCKVHRGEQLDLTSKAYLVFDGEVTIHPDEVELTLASNGSVESAPVVGIVSDAGEPDGDTAVVNRESVVVEFDRRALRELQQRRADVANAWNAQYGRRVGQLARRTRSKS